MWYSTLLAAKKISINFKSLQEIFLIGVITKESAKEIVKEFFELFKTPWEFYQENCSYDVILTTGENIEGINTKLLIIYGSEKTRFDYEKKIEINSTNPRRDNLILEYDGSYFPIYGKFMTFGATEKSLIRVKGTTEAVGIEIKLEDKKILRIGFDLFQETNFLLSSGQPAEHAYIPTLEMHISMLRNWILDSNIALIEIPPTPAGYAFTACLTHDVDFVGIRNHKFDHTLFGFIYRAFFCSVVGLFKGQISWNKLLKNWKAVLSLPGVYLGIAEDFMVQFDRYIEVEKGLGSTFFIIPHKNQAGQGISGQAPRKRAVRYDISDVNPAVKKLVSCGCEVGLHGIDAWQDIEKGREELKRISNVVGESNIGVRMHWLYYSNRSPQILEDSGFSYDSTFGYNDAVGYRGGTTQVFRPLGVRRLMELPMQIQDSALFYPSRMGLTETRALELVKQLFKKTTKHGGVLTINWHHRSIGPERLWDDFYITMLEELKKLNVWFGTARQVVKWFNKRRAVFFQNSSTAKDKMHIQITGIKDTDVPDLVLRIHYPETSRFKDTNFSTGKKKVDIPFTGGLDTVISI